jgi:ubiquinone/menaquinone biosynthesis C-methylase UbiE
MTTKQEVKNWYNERHIRTKEKSWRIPDAYKLVLTYFKTEPGKKFLDIGFGTGYLLKAAAEKGLETYGIDPSEEGAKIAQRNSPTSKIFVGFGEDLKFDSNFFDYVTCIGVLEHFLDIDKGLNEIRRVIKKDGTACIVVPNIDFIYWKFKKNKGTEQTDISETLMSLDGWRDRFIKQGFEVLGITKDDWYLKEPIDIKPFSFKKVMRAIKKLIYKFIWLFVPIKYTYQFVFILKKK